MLALLAISITACSDHSDKMVDYMSWSHDNQASESIKFDYLPDEVPILYLEVDYKGGDITLICNNYDNLMPIGIDGSNTYDCGWGVFTVDGRQVMCHFPEEASGKPETTEQIMISAQSGNAIVNTILLIKRTFGELIPEPEAGDVPDKYKFKFVEAGVTSLMGDNYPFTAPFDNITYRITDNYERYEPVGFPEFTQYYDSIVWCADNLPNTVRIYERENASTYVKQHMENYWSTHFFKKGEIKNTLKGYRNGEVVYSTSLTTTLRERDFLCYDWTNGSVAVGNPGNTAIYCSLDTRYEYQASHTQELNGTRYAQIHAWNKRQLPESEFLPVAKEALMNLMTDNADEGQSTSGKTESFKCLPSEGVDAVKFWESKTTRILLLLSHPDEYGLQEYYLHIESK